ncbi:MAG TPA: hypothetical protein VFY43_01495 [Candidatus Limnocylindria bacterium]|nr:hypothetical protein [Candidatus Limnocylindria bacterium]
MSIRLDPRRLAALKLLAAEAGMRPGELVTQWTEERLDAARRGEAAAAPAGDAKALAALSARIDELAARLDALAPQAAPSAATETAPAEAEAPAPKRRGRPPKSTTASTAAAKPKAAASAAPRVPLHEEIAAIISEQGPMSAVQLAQAITERGRYTAPRSTKPLDAATVSARVSNPAYRSRFVRRAGLISLAGTE